MWVYARAKQPIDPCNLLMKAEDDRKHQFERNNFEIGNITSSYIILLIVYIMSVMIYSEQDRHIRVYEILQNYNEFNLMEKMYFFNLMKFVFLIIVQLKHLIIMFVILFIIRKTIL